MTRHPNLALVLLCVASFLVALDFSIVNVALPDIRADLGFGQGDLQWVVSAYAIVFGGFLLVCGRAADLYGRLRLFVAGLVLLAAASLVAGFATTPGMLVASRAAQGLGSAIVGPAALSLLTTTFVEGERRNRALSAYGTMISVGFVSGAIAGGLLTELLSWRWTMFVFVPVSLSAALLAPVLLSESRDRSAARQLDVLGAVLIVAPVVALVYALSEAEDAGWLSGQTLGLLVAAGALSALFVFVEGRMSAPLVPLTFFRRRRVVLANVVGLLLVANVVGMVFVVTLFLQTVVGLSPLQTGLVFVADGITSILAGVFAARLAAAFGVGRLMVFGALLESAAAALLMILPGSGAVALVAVGVGLHGFGIITGQVMANIRATGGMPDEEQGLAGGLLTTAQQVGAGLGVAVVAAVAAARTGVLSNPGAEPTAGALVSGYRYGLGVAALMTVLAAVVAAVDLRASGKGHPSERQEIDLPDEGG